MPPLVNYGDDSVCPVGLLSMASSVDPYSPSCKRARIDDSCVLRGGDVAAEPQRPPCSMDALPDECLFEIFRRLSGPQARSVSACVSKRWLSLLSSIHASEVSVKKDAPDDSSKVVKKPLPDLNEYDVVIEGEMEPEPEPEPELELEADDNGFLTRTLENNEATDVRLAAMAVGTAGHGGLGKLVIRGSHPTRGVTDLGLSNVARGCPSLRDLAMWMVPSVTDAGLSEIAKGCPLLEKLDICDCPLITDKGLMAVAENCPNLMSLSIEACSWINNEGLQAIGRSCPKLQSISIRNCHHVGDQGVAGLVFSASASLRKIKLENLNITDSSLAVIGYYGKAVTDLALTGLQNVAERGFWVMGNALGMGKLKSIAITACPGATDIGLQAVAKGCPNLKQLCIQRCCFLSDAGLKAFVEAGRALESLQLEECNRITLVGVIAGLLYCKTKLKTLALVKCLGIKDVGVCPAKLPLCMSLRSLTIRECPEFTSRSLAFIGKICPRLMQVDLSGLVGVTDAGLLMLIKCSRSGLVKVNLSGCVNLTDVVVFNLVNAHGETLQLLHLDGCKNITDRSLLSISGSCSVLTDLDLSRCSIGDYGVAALASARQLDLQTLSLAGCSRVTERSLPFLGNMGQSLAGLNLQQCPISTRGICMLEMKLWGCDILS